MKYLSFDANIFVVRQTRQNTAIIHALQRAGRPLSPSEVLGEARKEAKSLGIATVYRNLKALQDEGSIIQVALPGLPARWEAAKKAHHHHFLCRQCDRLTDIHVCSRDLLGLVPGDYTLEEHDILLRGLCAECSKRIS